MRALSSSILAILVACGGDPAVVPDPPVIPAADPTALAAEVGQPALETSIQELAALTSRHTMGDGDERARDYLVARATAMGLTAELDPFTVGTEQANNIIIKHLGTTKPEIIYVFSAHYDSVSATPNVAPGADDNATGVAAVLEAARILTKHSFEHTIWFVLTAAEEQGSLGSKHMVEWIMAQGLQVKGAIAPDMIGYWPKGDDDLFDILGNPASQFLIDHMSAVATRLGVAHKTYIEHFFCYGDDHTSFQEAGIPAITPMDCVEAHNVANTTEDTPHYHQTSDTFETLYMPFTTKVVGVIVATLAELGQPIARAE